MPKMAPRDLEAFLKNTPRSGVIYVLHGPNGALRSELTKKIYQAYEIAQGDAFQSAVLDAGALEADPGRLADEVGAISMFGDLRLIEARPAARRASALVELARQLDRRKCIVTIASEQTFEPPREAGSDRDVAFVSCEDESERDFESFARAELDARGIVLSGCGIGDLLRLVPSDRLALRNEIEKLAAYLGGAGEATPEVLRIVVAALSDFVADELADAAYSGDPGRLAAAMDSYRISSGDPGAAMAAALWRCQSMLRAKAQNWGSGPHKSWREDALRGLSHSLRDAARAVRGDALTARQTAERALLEISRRARSQKK